MTEPVPEIKPCRKCGRQDHKINAPLGPAHPAGFYHVFCPNLECWQQGPWEQTPAAAIAAWNRMQGEGK